jgi:hypothetical protein
MPARARGTAKKRELLTPRGNRRFVRRDSEGKFKESDDGGRSLTADRRQKAKRTVSKGQGDKGDQRRKSKK